MTATISATRFSSSMLRCIEQIQALPKSSYGIYRSNHFLGESLDLSHFVSVTF
jgi:hypothetical protein